MTGLRIALPKGRLYERSVALFSAAGAAPAGDAGRRLLIPSADPAIEFLVVKPSDVPVYVESGAADLGVTGTDVLRETGADVLEPLELGFGVCRLVVASPLHGPYPSLPGGVTPRVATKYPNITQRWFERQGIQAECIKLNGAMELAPGLGLAGQIVDLVSTGRTLADNGLVETARIMDVSARLIVNRAALKTDPRVAALVEAFRALTAEEAA